MESRNESSKHFSDSKTACRNGSFFTVNLSWRTLRNTLPPRKAPENSVFNGLDTTEATGFHDTRIDVTLLSYNVFSAFFRHN